jgi:ATP-dependent exoDNAse (exonuclease V) beta subunit
MDVIARIRECQADIAVRAGAGTGKTTALVEKYMAELSAPRKEGFLGVDRIAAITFTEKAAEEMSQRVRMKLSEKIEELRGVLRAAGSTANLMDDPPGASQDRKLLNHLIRQRQAIKSAYISTIHAFCARLLWENPLEAGVDPGFAVMDGMAADALLEAAVVETVLTKLRQGSPGARRLVRDHGFQSRGRIEGLKERIIWIIPLLKASNMAPEKLIELHSAAGGAPPAAPPEALAARLNILCQKFLSMAETSKEHKFAAAMLETGDVFDNPGGITFAQAGDAMELADGLEEAVLGRVTYQRGTKDFAESLEAVRLTNGICGPVMEKAVAGDIKAFVELVSAALEAYARAKEARSLLDYNDLQEKARDLLVRSKDTLIEYRGMLRRILIDEFQDTDKLQAEILNLLAPPGEGRLFIVGDVKQSIYGFRGADPGVFIEQAERIKRSGGEEFPLVESRRATTQLTDYFNSFLSTVMAEGGPAAAKWFDPDKDTLAAVREGKGIDTAVCRIIAEGDGIERSRMVEAEAIAGEMKRLVAEKAMVEGADGLPRPAGYGDMALLLRSFTNHEVYEAALRRAGIPFQVVKGRGFYDCQEIKDLANLLFHIGAPGEKIALVSVLRSPLVGVKDETILRLFLDDDGKRRDNPLPPGGKIPKSITGDERERLEEFIRLRAEWAKTSGRVVASEMLEMILASAGYGAVMMSRHNGERIVANIFKLIERARTFEADWANGYANFIFRLNAMISTSVDEAKAEPSAGEGDVARIMTVHQSKGLEFAVVFVGDIGFVPKPAGGQMIFSPRAGLGLRVHDLASGKWRSGPSYKEAKQAADIDGDEELKRLLYVAMTRARDRLILSGPADGRGSWLRWINSIASDRVQTVAAARVNEGAPVVEKIEEAPLVQSILNGVRPAARPIAEKPPANPERIRARLAITSLADFVKCPRIYYHHGAGDTRDTAAGSAFGRSGEDSDPMAVGTMIHRALEAAPLGKGAWPGGINKAVRAALAGEKAGAIAAALHSVEAAFASEPLLGLKDVDPGAIIREAPLAMKISGDGIDLILHGAPDLLWFDGKTWRLADYKFSMRPKDEGRYLFQIRLYALAMMTAHGMDRLEAALVYLRQKRNRATLLTVGSEEKASIREEALAAGTELARLEGKPMDQWPRGPAALCRGIDCRFIGKCWRKPPKQAITR